mgnify:CR=1 FL=1
MRACTRIFFVLAGASLTVAVSACVEVYPQPVPTQTINAEPLVTECPDGILKVLSVRPDIDVVREIPAAEYPGPDAFPQLQVGRLPSCAFELTVNENRAVLHYAYYMGEGQDFVARLGGLLVDEGFIPGESNVADGGYWASGPFGVAVVHLVPGVYDEYPEVEFPDDVVFVW